MFQIQAKKRDASTKISEIREAGEIPAVFYGAGKATTSVSVPLNEFKKIWRDAGESTTVKLMLGTTTVDVLIHDVQVDPVKNEAIHVDFLAVDVNKPITVSVPLEFVGVSQAVKGGVGSLVKVLHEIEVEALPKDLPQNIQVDISKLVDADSNISVKDLVAPKGVTFTAKADEIVAAIAVAKEEKEEVPVDLSAIEVEKKGKKEEEGESKEA